MCFVRGGQIVGLGRERVRRVRSGETVGGRGLELRELRCRYVSLDKGSKSQELYFPAPNSP